MRSEEVLFKGRLLRLTRRTVRLPHGYVAQLEIITHPGAALIVPLLGRDRVILIRQLRPVVGAYLYELPAGTLNDRESPLACARREIIEETGYSARTLTRLGSILPVPGYSTEKITIFKAQGLRPCAVQPEADEVIRVCVKTRQEIRRLFKQGRIVDAKTICAFSMIGWL
ncbi:MAG TPA: NUDIX hydrolase [Candidatus Omnitrophota bacterium]|nr:NUDIX hydrolase [Candidatus Omnitrophota bacterium]HRZ14321.1 NUDIX hydrolase [Candidatus Omnitrophota bacterium]